MSSSPEEPIIEEITDVKMYNPETSQKKPIQRADFEGISDIFEDDQVEELREEGWFTRGIGAKVSYRNRVYKVIVSGNSRVGLVKIEGIKDPDIGRELHSLVRDRFLDNFRIYPQVLD